MLLGRGNRIIILSLLPKIQVRIFVETTQMSSFCYIAASSQNPLSSVSSDFIQKITRVYFISSYNEATTCNGCSNRSTPRQKQLKFRLHLWNRGWQVQGWVYQVLASRLELEDHCKERKNKQEQACDGIHHIPNLQAWIQPGCLDTGLKGQVEEKARL